MNLQLLSKTLKTMKQMKQHATIMMKSYVQWKMAQKHSTTLLVHMQYTHIHCLYCINHSLQIAALDKNATADNVSKEEEKGEGFNTDSQGSSNTTETTPTDGKPTEAEPSEPEPTESPNKDKKVRIELLTK